MSSIQQKRELTDPESSTSNLSKKSKTVCSYKEKCYRKNPHHFKEYEHPHLDDLLLQSGDNLKIPDECLDKSVVEEQLKILRELKKPSQETWQKFTSGSSSSCIKEKKETGFAAKLRKNAPYNVFFTVIPKSSVTGKQTNSIKITDLLCPSLGVLESSMQINFMIDIIWVMEQYHATNNHMKPLTILYGEEFPKMKEYIAKYLPNVTAHFVKMQDPFGTHHSKVGLYYYADRTLRIHVSTANLYAEDWSIYCQAVWVSPGCPPLPTSEPDTNGCGPTGFKNALLTYLRSYQAPCLSEWIRRVQRADFSAVNVFLITSIPGKYQPKSSGGHINQVGDLLSRHCKIPTGETPVDWPVIAQASSIGNLGTTPAAWLRGGLLRSLASHVGHALPANSNAQINVIFPSKQDVLNSYHGSDGGGCLPYSKNTHEKQKWLESYLCCWRANETGRTRAMPHIKSYCRISPCLTKIAYFLLTSANISKAAWGSLNKDFSSYVRSYECGVLFLPKFFKEEYFSIAHPKVVSEDKTSDEKPTFPIVYDLPLTPYGSNDKPWTM